MSAMAVKYVQINLSFYSHIAVYFIFGLGLLLSVYLDFKSRRVPNILTLTLLSISLFYHFPNYSYDSLLFCILVFIGWKFGVLGGADAKLWMAYVMLWNTKEAVLIAGVTMIVTAVLQIVVLRMMKKWQSGKKDPGAWRLIPYFIISMILFPL